MLESVLSKTEYGLYVNQLTKGTTSNYAVYTNGSTQSFFGGNVGLEADAYGWRGLAAACSPVPPLLTVYNLAATPRPTFIARRPVRLRLMAA